MPDKSSYIAVFDSGVGGISILRQLRQLMPQERYLYFGDSANAPYGTRSGEAVRQLTLAAARYLLSFDIKALVIACNTATAAAISLLRQTYPELIIIGVEPAVKVAADHYPGKTVGILATPLTLHSEKLEGLMDRFADRCKLIPLPAPGLADLVEQGKGNSPEARELLAPILAPYAGILDAVVLGCTHYPFTAETISSLLGANTVLLDGGLGTARETRRRLAEADLLGSGEGDILWKNSLNDPGMLQLSQQLLDLPM